MQDFDLEWFVDKFDILNSSRQIYPQTIINQKIAFIYPPSFAKVSEGLFL